ncbi:MAG: hypothetical protein AB7G37_06325 [Solirubrobacteraceae bacterium]
MFVVDSAQMLPGACYLTGNDRGPFIDTNRDVDGLAFGRVYLSQGVVEDMGALFGMAPAAAVERLTAEMAAMAARAFELEQERDAYKAAVEALRRAGYSEEETMAISDKPFPTQAKRTADSAALAASAIEAAGTDDLAGALTSAEHRIEDPLTKPRRGTRKAKVKA